MEFRLSSNHSKILMKFLKSALQTGKIKLTISKGLFVFLWKNKMWWLMPMVAILLLFFLLVISAQSSPLGVFIYTIF